MWVCRKNDLAPGAGLATPRAASCPLRACAAGEVATGNFVLALRVLRFMSTIPHHLTMSGDAGWIAIVVDVRTVISRFEEVIVKPFKCSRG